MKMIWNPVYECDDEDDNPTVWALEINSSKYGKYAWISLEDDNEFSITTSNYGSNLGSEPLMVCKSLKSAKRWVSMNIR